jgi:alpha-methylacyl-CoA racemase
MPGPLQGTRVIEIAGSVSVAYAATALADLGADVVRVDRPTPPAAAMTDLSDPLSRSRHTISVDLKDESGRERVRQLARSADVFLEGFRPGVAERLGIGPSDCTAENAGLIYGRVTGWGQTGPLAGQAGHDITFMAVSGALAPSSPAGQPSEAPPYYVSSFVGGALQLVTGVLAALVERSSSGRGQVIDTAMVEGMTTLVGLVAGWREVPGRQSVVSAPFYRSYECADGRYISVGAVEERFYAEFLSILDLSAESLPSQYDEAGWPELTATLAEVLRTRSSSDWEKAFADSNACVAPVLTPAESAHHPQLVHRKAWVKVGSTDQPSPGPRFSRTELAVPRAGATGTDVDSVLRDWQR